MPDEPNDAVTMYDPQGKPVRIPRQQWIDQVLPQSLKVSWANPDALYAVIVMALREQQASAIGDAINQLARIDPNLERVAVTRGIAQMQMGQTAAAEETFQSFIKSHGETGTILTNLAKVYFDRGDTSTAGATLERALAIDPNLDHGLGWLVSAARETGGDAGATAALSRIAQHPASWRAQLWIARDHIAAKRVEPALELYRLVLTQREVAPEGVIQITGDLGNAGLLDEMIDTVAPYFQLEKHGPYAGMNLLQAMVTRRRQVEASLLLPKLQALNNPSFTPHLADFARKLGLTTAGDSASEMAMPPTAARPSQEAAASQEGQAANRIAAVPLFYPIWMSALNAPEWLVTPIAAERPNIAFFSLADARQTAESDAADPDHPAARLTRSLPMYLAETLRLRGAASTLCILPVIPRVGPVLSRTPWPLAHMLASCPEGFIPDIVVCGAITQGARGLKVELHLFKGSDKSAIRTLRVGLNADYSGGAEKLVDDLTTALAPQGVIPGAMPAGWNISQPEAYKNALGNLFVQTLASSRVIETGHVHNEAAMVEGYFDLAAKDSATPLPVFLAIAGVIAARRCQSPAADQYTAMLRALLDAASPRHSEIQKLLPVVYRHLDDDDAVLRAEAAVKDLENGEYGKWLESLREPAPVVSA